MKHRKVTTKKMLLALIIALTAANGLFAQGNSQNNSNGLWYAKDGDTVATNREVLITKNLKVQGNVTADSAHYRTIVVGDSSLWIGAPPQQDQIGLSDNIQSNNGVINFGNTDFPFSNIKVGIGTTNPTEKLHIKDGSIYVEGEGQGIIVNEGGQKRVGLMKYYGREAGIWRVINQDFEIGRLDVPSLPGTPTTFTTDLYVAGNGFVGINTTNQLIFVL